MVKMNGCAAIDFRPSVSLFGRQGGGCRRFPFGKWRLLTWETENSKHSKCMYTCEIRRGTTGISLQNSKQAPVSTHTGACHSGKQCTAVPTSHYLPTAKRTWQAMLVFIHPCNLVGELPQTPERFQRNRLRSYGAERRNFICYSCGGYSLHKASDSFPQLSFHPYSTA